MTELEKSKAIIQYIADAKKTTPVELYTDEDIKKENDIQLEEAKKVLKSFIENTYLNLSIDKYKENKKK